MAQGIISSLGIGSGLDTSSIVDQLVAAERRPRELQLNRSQKSLEAQLSGFGKLAAALDKLDNTTSDLGNLSDSRTASVSENQLLSVSAEAGAQTGSYTIETLQQAQAQSLVSATYSSQDAVVGTGTLSVTIDGNNSDIVIDSDNNTLAGIRDAINDADIGVTAMVINNDSGSQLLLSADKTGTANSVELTVADDDGNDADTQGLSNLAFNASTKNLTESVTAKDAKLEVNGVTVTRSTNQFGDVVPGVNIKLLAEEPGTLIEVKVERNAADARKSVSDFVDALGNIGKQINKLTAYDPETGQSGVLQGDSAARGLQSRLREGLVTDFGSDASFDQLVDIGITTDSDGGIAFDKTKFDAALESDFDGVTSLLSAAATHYSGLVSDFGEESGLIGSRTDSLKSRLENVNERRIDLDRRMEQVESRIRDEFAALDSLISDLQNTGNFLSSQLANLPKPG